jgi:hypothetical protein
VTPRWKHADERKYQQDQQDGAYGHDRVFLGLKRGANTF